jgi:phosphatidylinositol alpha-1,6-mannosyltransferase
VEGFGIVYIEANCCGKPVIGGNVGGAKDAVIDGKTGILVDPLDTDAIAKTLVRILRNPALAARLGRQGRERAERELDWPVLGKKMQAVLDAAGKTQ